MHHAYFSESSDLDEDERKSMENDRANLRLPSENEYNVKNYETTFCKNGIERVSHGRRYCYNRAKILTSKDWR